MSEIVSYIQPNSAISPSFWNKLTEIKLNVDKLDDSKRHIWGSFNKLPAKDLSLCILEVDSTSFNCDFSEPNCLPVHGTLYNTNTIEQFKECDKNDLLNEIGKQLFEKIVEGHALDDPSKLNTFLVLSFADLKKYHYYYWFAFPVPKGLTLEKTPKNVVLKDFYAGKELEKVLNQHKVLGPEQQAYFLIENHADGPIVHTLSAKLTKLQENNYQSYLFAFYNVETSNNLFLSQLRNYVALILFYCPFLKGKLVDFLAFKWSRNKSGVNCEESKIYTFLLDDFSLNDETQWVGWEANERGKMGPRMANMKNSLDPLVLAENAVDLNLKLMKWRLLPNIDLEKIKETKCLLLGAGTLGCGVARMLLAWGVRTITFVDNSTVSLSNPVRQNLFTYKDSVEGKDKAKAAADNLKTIFPGVLSSGENLNIPMPGHPIGTSLLKQTQNNVKKLEELIKHHDAVFLLMDSRESRWFPTLLGALHDKIVINAALGFDTYLVMRHGSRNDFKLDESREGFKTIPGNNLGCYFCNDVTSPGNSIKDRTLDQQCTVTRPGVSQIASALAVELLISILQHPLSSNAPAFYKLNRNHELGDEVEEESLLGLLPHSIRGFLNEFSQILPATEKYQQCIGCSNIVVEKYKQEGWTFLQEVFNNSRYLEDITGLSEMFKQIDSNEMWELSDDE